MKTRHNRLAAALRAQALRYGKTLTVILPWQDAESRLLDLLAMQYSSLHLM